MNESLLETHLNRRPVSSEHIFLAWMMLSWRNGQTSHEEIFRCSSGDFLMLQIKSTSLHSVCGVGVSSLGHSASPLYLNKVKNSSLCLVFLQLDNQPHLPFLGLSPSRWFSVALWSSLSCGSQAWRCRSEVCRGLVSMLYVNLDDGDHRLR